MGEWVKQGGYGYESEPAFEPIEWDGETEGREVLFEYYYKVAEEIDVTKLVGAVGTFVFNDQSHEFICVSAREEFTNVYIALFGELGMCIVIEDTEYEGVEFHKGVYFLNNEGVYQSSLTSPSSVHKIDPKFIPQGGGGSLVVNLTVNEETGTITADKTNLEIVSADTAGTPIVFRLLEMEGVSCVTSDYFLSNVEGSFLIELRFKVYGGSEIVVENNGFAWYVNMSN